MNTYIGIDLGTSAVKLLLMDAGGKVLNTVSNKYEVYYPNSGWSEQNPSDWYSAVLSGLKLLLSGFERSSVKAISFSGQMHGLVAIDRQGEVIRPAILWNDGRSKKETEYLNQIIGKKRLSELTGNIAFPGFTAPKILWLKENEPDNYDAINKILLPKDYLIYRLCGEYATDYSDAAGTLLLDVKKRCWSQQMCEICGVKKEWLPKLNESFEVVGALRKDIANELGLSESVKIVAGAGDNAAAAIGTGTITNGACNISLGTSGTIFIASDNFALDEKNALHSFCHANGKYHLLGCILSAGACNEWWINSILKSSYASEEIDAEKYLGVNNVFFLPYLMGERSPHNDVNARGAFIGLQPDTSRVQMTLSVLEGVAFALNDCCLIARQNGIPVERAKICGGGAKSRLWKTIISNVLELPLDTLTVEEGPSYGAAILASCGAGEYASVQEAVNECVRVSNTVLPDKKIMDKYRDRYSIFRKFYPALKDVFAVL